MQRLLRKHFFLTVWNLPSRWLALSMKILLEAKTSQRNQELIKQQEKITKITEIYSANFSDFDRIPLKIPSIIQTGIIINAGKCTALNSSYVK